jgi:hypothetical protein
MGFGCRLYPSCSSYNGNDGRMEEARRPFFPQICITNTRQRKGLGVKLGLIYCNPLVRHVRPNGGAIVGQTTVA